MISTDENALICDLAETYHIYDYRSLPVSLVATLSVGLRADSRIMMKISHNNLTIDQSLTALLLDSLNYLRYELGGNKRANKPKSVYQMLSGTNKTSNYISFKSGSDFMKYRQRILKKEG